MEELDAILELTDLLNVAEAGEIQRLQNGLSQCVDPIQYYNHHCANSRAADTEASPGINTRSTCNSKSKSECRRDIRGPPTVPSVTPGCPVRRRLDTSGDIRACLDDLDAYVSSDKDDITNDEFMVSREWASSSEEDVDDPLLLEEEEEEEVVVQTLPPDRLSCQNYISRHFMELIPCDPRPNRRNVQRICVVCAHTKRRQRVRKRTSYQCHECKVALCHPCFVDYHTISDY
ncbi:hypothetical protein Pcinc_021002 [Petrolisthes cinctipes]|uniref:PiggyBac transposable element-derived protein 4 C-terminal zinc-finger domain-containing protein n=1 Tax=Petrolisthes cinctipes TaxID=88211 RepID=A0AAE1KJ05_PETCI|nr:hypothetical protein Pcinc_021002 [Petrolisthes cinctipes]